MDIASDALTAIALERRKRLGLLYAIKRTRGTIIIAILFVALFTAITTTGSGSFSYFEANFMSSGGATLALAAMGQTLVVLTGGFDLSVGATVSLVNVVLATTMGDSWVSQLAQVSARSTDSLLPSSGCSRSLSRCRQCS
jgi:ribose transport system permease protein